MQGIENKKKAIKKKSTDTGLPHHITLSSEPERKYRRIVSDSQELILTCSTLFECEALLHVEKPLLQDYLKSGFVLVCSDCRQVPDIVVLDS